MRIGSQRTIITIQRKVQAGVDKLNAPIFVLMDWRADIFCDVEVRRGKEQFDPNSKIRYSEEVWRFRTRYDEVVGLDASMQIIHEGSTFNIKAVLPDDRRRSDCVIECTVQDAVLGAPPLSIAVTDAIDAGTVGLAYSLQMHAVGGTSPYAFSIQSGTLPAGLTLSSGSGLISGTPSASVTSTVILKVADASGDTASLPAIEIMIEPA